MENKHLGKLVFVERLTADNKPEYNSGEYICVAETQNCIYCVKPEVGYGFHNKQAFNLVGTAKWEVVSSLECNNLLRTLILDNEEYCTNEKNSIRKQWIESVYSGILSTCQALRRAFPTLINNEPEQHQVVLKKGTTILIKVV